MLNWMERLKVLQLRARCTAGHRVLPKRLTIRTGWICYGIYAGGDRLAFAWSKRSAQKKSDAIHKLLRKED